MYMYIKWFRFEKLYVKVLFENYFNFVYVEMVDIVIFYVNIVIDNVKNNKCIIISD